MNNQDHDTERRIVRIISEIMEPDDDQSISDILSADIDEWDSLSVMSILLNTEKEFQIKLTYEEILELQSLQDIIMTVQNKKKGVISMADTIVGHILTYGRTQPDKLAIIDGDRRITYRELADQILTICNKLSEHGLTSSETVLLAAQPCAEYLATYFAVHLAGAISVPVPKASTPDSVRSIKNQLHPALILLDYPVWENAAPSEYPFLSDLSSDMVADILYTSGVTGSAKGVIRTHGNILSAVYHLINGCDFTDTDITLIPVPLHHAYGHMIMHAVFASGGAIVLQNGFSSLRTMNAHIQKDECTRVCLVPSIIPILLQQTQNNLNILLGSLRSITFCTAPLGMSMRKTLLQQLPTIAITNIYGATEYGGVIFLKLNDSPQGLSSIGKPLPGIDIRIVDEIHLSEPKPLGEIGRLAIHGDMVMQGYYGQDELTARMLQDSWFYTNDLGYQDEDGYIYLDGRLDDLLIIGGEKVMPADIEAVALNSDLIYECVCVGYSGHPILGDVPILFITLKSGKSVKQLKDYLSEHLERYMVPQKIIELHALPQTHTGKIDRNKLKKIAEEQDYAW